MDWSILGIFYLISLVGCCMGFKKYVYFLSIGYGISVGLLSCSYFVAANIRGYVWNWLTVVQCALLLIYAVRLSGFLIVRLIKNGAYRKVLKEAIKEDEKPMPVFVKAAIWLCVGVLYVAQTAPVWFRLQNGQGNGVVLPLIGIAISVFGLIVEAIADKQKSAQKAINPNMVATEGLYKIVRCPNYFGEILFWTGVFVGALNAALTVGQWITVVLGYVFLVYVMFNGAQRLDKRQEGRYGKQAEYRAYADHTPILLPLIPLYHLGDYQGKKKQ